MGSLYKRGRIYWYAYYKSGKRFRKSLKTRDRETARYLASKIDQDIIEHKYIAYEADPACEKLLSEYTEASRHRKTEKTIKNDESRIREFLKWTGIIKIRQITEKKLEEYFNHRINDNKLTLSSANRIISTIKAWLNFGVRRKIIFENPIRYFKGYNPGKRHPKFLPIEDVQKIINASKGSRLYYPILVALYTGMRVEEIYQLEWPDIDFVNDYIIVKHGGVVITKSKKERVVPMPEKFKQYLLPVKKESGLCFDSTNRKHDFPKIICAAGLKNIGFHHFRHTYASHLAMAGVDLYTIAQLLGHSDIKVTEQYAYLTRDHKKAAVNKLPY